MNRLGATKQGNKISSLRLAHPQIPSGLMVNRLNARKLLLAGVALWSAATVLATSVADLALSPGTSALAMPVSIMNLVFSYPICTES